MYSTSRTIPGDTLNAMGVGKSEELFVEQLRDLDHLEAQYVWA